MTRSHAALATALLGAAIGAAAGCRSGPAEPSPAAAGLNARDLIDPAARRLLEANGWTQPRYQDRAPSGAELVEKYLMPFIRGEKDRWAKVVKDSGAKFE